MFSVGATHCKDALPFALCTTAIANEGKEACVVPSLTLIVMLGSLPTSPAAGVPDKSPVAALNFAQLGAF